jgi:hypothetical protein
MKRIFKSVIIFSTLPSQNLLLRALASLPDVWNKVNYSQNETTFQAVISDGPADSGPGGQKRKRIENQTILFHVNLHDDFLGHGLCGNVYRTTFDGDSVHLMLLMRRILRPLQKYSTK